MSFKQIKNDFLVSSFLKREDLIITFVIYDWLNILLLCLGHVTLGYKGNL